MSESQIWPAFLLAFLSGAVPGAVVAYYASRSARQFASLLDLQEQATAKYQVKAVQAEAAHRVCADRLRVCQERNAELMASFEAMMSNREEKR